MKEDRFAKKALLFFSDDATVWKKTAEESSQLISEVLRDFIGPNLDGKLEDWLGGKKKQNFGALTKRIRNKAEKYHKNYKIKFPTDDVINAVLSFKNDSVSVYDFASLIKTGISDAERIIDKHYYENNPFPELLRYPTSTSAELEVELRGGTYRVFLERGGITIQGRMRIRYELDRLVRVKLNLYRYRATKKFPKPYHEYDGFIKCNDGIIVGIFEERDKALSPDFFHFTLNAPNDIATINIPWFGHYLSSTKGDNRQSVSGRMCIYRTRDNEQTDDDLIAFMHNPDENVEREFSEFLEENGIGKV